MTLSLESDDAAFLEEFDSLFGCSHSPDAQDDTSLRCQVALDAHGGRVAFRLWGDDLQDPAAPLLGLTAADVPIRALEADPPWRVLALGDDPEPLLAFRGERGMMRAVPRWRRILSHVVFLRLLRLRPDVLFLHAASVEIHGRGALLIGPKGSGKTTLSLALAARGHGLLGDETAAYEAAGRRLLPMPRPVAIKPGPRSAAVDAALGGFAGGADPEGLLRVRIGELFPKRPDAALAPLHAVVFLSGFAAVPRLEPVTAGREELASLQPLVSALAPGAHTARVFAMVRLLGSAACFRVVCGAPDMSAALLEEVLAR